MKIHANYIKHNLYAHKDIYISEYAWIDPNVEVLYGTSVYHFCVLREGVVIGYNCTIGHGVLVEKNTKIGNETTIQSQCHITAEALIGNKVFLGPCVVTMNEKNIANLGRTEKNIERLVIEDGARIGAGAILTPGVHIGKNAFVKAGSLVVKDVGEAEIWGQGPDGRAVHFGDVPEEEWL